MVRGMGDWHGMHDGPAEGHHDVGQPSIWCDQRNVTLSQPTEQLRWKSTNQRTTVPQLPSESERSWNLNPPHYVYEY